mgnify:CR=1 FL=1
MYSSKEKYNEYMRNYYKKYNNGKNVKVLNMIDEIVMEIFKARENKVSQRDLILKLIKLKNMVKLPKMEFTVPDEIVDFLNEDIKNPLMNTKNENKNENE